MGPGAGGKSRYILALAYGPNLGPLVSLSRTRLSLLLYVLVLSQRALLVHIVMSLSPRAVLSSPATGSDNTTTMILSRCDLRRTRTSVWSILAVGWLPTLAGAHCAHVHVLHTSSVSTQPQGSLSPLAGVIGPGRQLVWLPPRAPTSTTFKYYTGLIEKSKTHFYGPRSGLIEF